MLEISKIESTLSNNEDQSKSFDDEIASYQKELEAENRELLLNKARLEATLEENLLDGKTNKK